jgi:hypothetical protein
MAKKVSTHTMAIVTHAGILLQFIRNLFCWLSCYLKMVDRTSSWYRLTAIIADYTFVTPYLKCTFRKTHILAVINTYIN